MEKGKDFFSFLGTKTAIKKKAEALTLDAMLHLLVRPNNFKSSLIRDGRRDFLSSQKWSQTLSD